MVYVDNVIKDIYYLLIRDIVSLIVMLIIVKDVQMVHAHNVKKDIILTKLIQLNNVKKIHVI